MNWSIENELLQISGEDNISSAVQRLGIFNQQKNFDINIEKNWFRSGSETYSLVFSVSTEEAKQLFFMKACCPTSISKSVESTLERWIAKRKLLTESGVNTPKLYYFGKGIIIEEFIPLELSKKILTENNRKSIRCELTKIAISLDDLKFCPISPFSNLMSRGSDVVFVDFGVDIGENQSKDHDTDRIWRDFNLKITELGL